MARIALFSTLAAVAALASFSTATPVATTTEAPTATGTDIPAAFKLVTRSGLGWPKILFEVPQYPGYSVILNTDYGSIYEQFYLKPFEDGYEIRSKNVECSLGVYNTNIVCVIERDETCKWYLKSKGDGSYEIKGSSDSEMTAVQDPKYEDWISYDAPRGTTEQMWTFEASVPHAPPQA
ncbi:hypothetical protein DFQ27_009422 [Actinomortierella ambigua]|uniref:Ricin B lectin domain-containing protein n=1 Tax=Actinomortierella ambigua TaxID=1343610 RepID=A0A9P6PPR3_9FUNG|nr:hypothetical protein DFQ27_009422 [Actinomortierella ambigua]